MTATATEPGYCSCGCGGRTKNARQTDPRRGTVRGQPQRFLKGHRRRKHPTPAKPRFTDEERALLTRADAARSLIDGAMALDEKLTLLAAVVWPQARELQDEYVLKGDPTMALPDKPQTHDEIDSLPVVAIKSDGQIVVKTGTEERTFALAVTTDGEEVHLRLVAPR